MIGIDKDDDLLAIREEVMGDVVSDGSCQEDRVQNKLGVSVSGSYMRKDINRIVVVVAERWPSWCWIFQIMN